ncbi:unnamed protein product [Trifolium pratense]|uniref:Uncharacterized protein n=1 Tax=Trifolium pratense TaxID=57577 RepID=A0ACB0JT62_TRIPR|nr:unnamed protein product [Trifolium pratense]
MKYSAAAKDDLPKKLFLYIWRNVIRQVIFGYISISCLHVRFRMIMALTTMEVDLFLHSLLSMCECVTQIHFSCMDQEMFN